MVDPGAAATPGWTDVPSTRHGNAGTLSFADGHAELHHWVEPSTALSNNPDDWNSAPGSNGQPNRDIAWILQRMISPQFSN